MPRAKKSRKKPRTTDTDADPNKLARQEAGSYRTADDWFEVREAGTGWFLVDSQQANEFGQELMQGPFATLNAVREALPEARRTTLKPLPRAKPSKAGSKPGRKPAAKGRAKPEPPPPPPSWIDQLPRADAAAVRSLIRALERQGLTDAEQLVRTDREGLGPEVATRLIQQRLEEIVADLPAKERAGASKVVQRVAELLSAEGTSVSTPMPGWTLVEIGPEPEPPNRRIILRE
ncbi:MAG: hypothetical protein ACRDGV_10075 [Candidatus Limnocylindria bacterium]